MTPHRSEHVDSRSTKEIRQLLLRYLLGDLPDEAATAIEDRLAREPALLNQLDGLRHTQAALLNARADSFGPYFQQRVLRRLQPELMADRAQALYDSLRSLFARAAIVCLLAAAALGTLNVLSYGGGEVASSVPEAMFGLPSATLMDALDYPVL